MSKIKTYEDLEIEKVRLTALLKNHEEAIRYDMAGVREGLKPVSKAVNVINKMATRDNSGPMLNFGLEMSIDILLRRFILKRAGWFAKIVVPYMVKNYTSHILGEEKREALLQKMRSFFSKVRPKPEADPDVATAYSQHAEPQPVYPTQGGMPPNPAV